MLWSILNEIISIIISSPVITDSNKQTKIARDAGEIDLHPFIMSPSFLWGQVRMTMLILLHVHTHTLTVCENSISSISSFSCSLGFFSSVFNNVVLESQHKAQYEPYHHAAVPESSHKNRHVFFLWTKSSKNLFNMCPNQPFWIWIWMNMHKRTIQNIVYGEALPEKSLVADGSQMILCRYVVPCVTVQTVERFMELGRPTKKRTGCTSRQVNGSY